MEAYGRRGLVRDVSTVLTDAKIGIQSMNTHQPLRHRQLLLHVLAQDFTQ